MNYLHVHLNKCWYCAKFCILVISFLWKKIMSLRDWWYLTIVNKFQNHAFLNFLIYTLRLCDYWLTYLYIYICTVSISNNYGKFSESEINYNKGPSVVCICFNFFKRQAMIKIDSFFFLQTSAYLYVEQREKKMEKKWSVS